jgi:hypothetical protein
MLAQGASMNADVIDRLSALERRVSLLELRAHVLRSANNRRVLEVLDTFAKSPFNDGTLSMTPYSISTATRLDARDLALALEQLRYASFVELTKVDFTEGWRITDDGSWALTG